MRKNEEDHGARLIRMLTSVLAGGGVAFAISVIVLAGGAALISAGRLSEGTMEQVTLCASVLGCFAGGLYSVRQCQSRLLLTGLAVGGIYYLLWVTAGLLTCGTDSLLGNLQVLCAGLLGGAVAGFWGARPKKRRK